MRSTFSKTLTAAVAVVGLATVAVARWQAPAAAPIQAPAAAPAPAAVAQPAAPAQPAVATRPAAPLAAVHPADFKPSTPAEQALMAQVAAFVKAYEAGDAQALTALYADDAVIVDPDGLEIKGKDEIGKMYAESFADGGGLKLDSHVEAVRFITPDVARIEGRSRVSVPGGDAAEFIRFSTLAVQKAGAWTIAEIREYPMPLEDVEPYERLKVLEWMVGDWVNEGQHDKVTAQIKWAENHSYLIRTYSVELEGRAKSSGTMFIGWDPQTGQIKSWLFDSEGGRGEGVWTQTDENQWVVKAQGVMRNGLPNSTTLIHTILNKDSIKTDSVDRIIGGMIDDDILDVVMVRKAPPPAAGGAPQPK